MILVSCRYLAIAAAAAVALQPIAGNAQQQCVTEAEVSAIAIYSVPSLVEAVRLRCQGELARNSYLNRPNTAIKTRYAALQTRTWPLAKSGLLKVFAGRAGGAQSGMDLNMVRNLPDNALRPLVDALIVQEVSGKIDTDQCGRIERIIELAAPIDPEIAGNVLGAVIGLINPKELPVCPRRS
jgi:hypothetical protein